MPQIAPGSLLSLEAYARERNSYRSRVIAHKKLRTVHAGDHVTLVFEDEQTIRYQVQEMLRIERIFEEDGIRGELEAYNPLIPDGGNWKATMLIEYPEADERRRRLAALKGIEDELNAYNPLIPDGSNWKATFMIEYGDENERRVALGKMIGVEHRVWVQVAGFAKVWPIADEDLERATEDKTSAVHFLRFELDENMRRALKQGAGLSAGVDHPNYRASVGVAPAVRDCLVNVLA